MRSQEDQMPHNSKKNTNKRKAAAYHIEFDLSCEQNMSSHILREVTRQRHLCFVCIWCWSVKMLSKQPSATVIKYSTLSPCPLDVIYEDPFCRPKQSWEILIFNFLICFVNRTRRSLFQRECGVIRAETAHATASSLKCNWKTEGESQAITKSSTLGWFVTLYW